MSLASKRREALTAGLRGGDRTKLGLMIGGLIMVLAILGAASFYAGNREQGESEPARDTEGIGNAEDAGVIETGPGGRMKVRVDVDDDDWDMGLGREKPVDPEKLRAVRDDTDRSQAVIEPEPLDYLLHHVLREPSIRRKVLGFDALDRDALLGAPSRYRGRAVEFKGRLLEGRDRTYTGELERVITLHRGFIELLVPGKDGEEPGELISFTSVGQPVFMDREDEPARPGSVVRVQGFFLKTWSARPPGADPESLERVATPHLVVRRFIESYRIETQRELDPFWFKVGDGADLDEPPFWLCLNYLLNLTPEVYRERRDGGAFEVVAIPEPTEEWPTEPVAPNLITDFSSRGKLLDEHHKAYRGRIVRLSGTLYAADPVAPPENPGGIKRYYDCVLALESNYIIPAVAPFPPSRYGAAKGQVVEIEGYFYKRRIWETRSGDRRLRAPLLLVTDIIPREIGEGGYAQLGWILGGIALVFVVVLVSMLVLDRRAAKTAPRARPGRKARIIAPAGAAAAAEDEAKAGDEDGEG